MELNVIGDRDKSKVITTAHLKRVILEVKHLIKGSHEISDVRFIVGKDSPVVVVLIYDVQKNLIIEHKGKDDDTYKPKST